MPPSIKRSCSSSLSMVDDYLVAHISLALYHVRRVTAQTTSVTNRSERNLVALLSPFFVVEFFMMANRPLRILLSFLCASENSSLWCLVCLLFRAIMLIAYSSLSKRILDRGLTFRDLHIDHGEAEVRNECFI